MASTLAALLAKYDALTAAGFPNSTRPAAFEDRAPEVSAGLQFDPPYVLFTMVSANEILTFESDELEESRLTATAFYPGPTTLLGQAGADQVIKAIRFNNQNKDQYAGFDNSNSLPTLTEGILLSIIPLKPSGPSLAGRFKEGILLYKAMMEWLVTVQRS